MKVLNSLSFRRRSPRELFILQVSTSDIGGGAEIVARRLLNSYRERGYKSWMAVGRKLSGDPNVFVIPNDEHRNSWARMWSMIATKTSGFKGSRIRGSICNWIGQPRRQLNRWQGKEDFEFPGTWDLLNLTPEKPDIIHCHNLHGLYFDLHALPKLSHEVLTILTLHDAWLLSGNCAHSFDCERWKSGCGQCPNLDGPTKRERDATAYNWKRKQEIYLKSRLFVATPCNWLMKRVEQSILASSVVGKRVIPNGTDLSIFHPNDSEFARDALGLPHDTYILLFIGHGTYSNRYKDYFTLESALKEVASKNKRVKLLLICLGEERPESEIRLGSARIRFIGFQRDPNIVAKYYQAADIYIQASKADTFPNTVVEASACGTPVVASAVGGIPEIVKDGKTGFLVPPNNPNDMADRIELLLENKGLRDRFAEDAAEYAKKRFDINHQVEKYIKWYEEIIEKTT